jgi:hypothetical protein
MGEIPEGMQVAYLDNVPENNALSNLTLVATPLRRPVKGKYHTRGTFDTKMIKHDIESGIALGEIAAKHGCSYQYCWNLQKKLGGNHAS